MRPPPPPRGFAAAAALLALLLVEACGQALFLAKFRRLPYAFAREQFHGEARLYMTDHPYLPYLATKGRASENVEFDSRGARGPEPESPKRRVRLVCYGGSTTFDGSHRREETWPGMLEEMLGADRYEVINAAQNGAATPDSLVNLALLQSDLKPDYVLALEGINDLESSFMPGFRPDYAHRRRKIADERYPVFRRLPRWLDASSLYVLLRWKLVGPRGDLHAMFSRPGLAYDFENGPFGLATYRRNLVHLDAIARENGARLVLGTPPFRDGAARSMFGEEFARGFRRGIDAHNAIVRELARSRPNVLLAEVSASFPEPTDALMTDFCHFTAEGNRLVASAFRDAVARAEKARRGGHL